MKRIILLVAVVLLVPQVALGEHVRGRLHGPGVGGEPV